MQATEEGHHDCVRSLVKAGPDVNNVTKFSHKRLVNSLQLRLMDPNYN